LVDLPDCRPFHPERCTIFGIYGANRKNIPTASRFRTERRELRGGDLVVWSGIAATDGLGSPPRSLLWKGFGLAMSVRSRVASSGRCVIANSTIIPLAAS